MDEAPDRLTVVESVYHRPFEREPVAIDNRFSRILTTKEQVYQRFSVVSQEWEPLDCGWLKDNVGMIVISNDEGDYKTFNPPEEERLETEKKILELQYQTGTECWFIPPGESFRGYPEKPDQLLIHSQYGETRYTLAIFPK